MAEMKIGSTKIGKGYRTYFIADIAANHDGDLERAKHLIHLAGESGADAAKFQNFKAPKIVNKLAFDSMPRQAHQAGWSKSVYQVYEEASVPDDWTLELKSCCEKAGIEYFSSPYDFEAVDYLENYVNAYKIGSGDINWTEYLEYIAKKGKPVIIAAGASDIRDVDFAVNTIKKFNGQLALLQCNTNYTASLENFRYVNLNVLKTFSTMYPDLVLGLSDHTPGHAAVLGAITLGASIIEKHFTDDNGRTGPDHRFAMNPASFREMVDRTRELEFALGSGIKKVEENERQSAIVQRRCLYAARNLEAGHTVGRGDIDVLRPVKADGILPQDIEKLVGTTLKKSVGRGEHYTWRHL